MDDDSIQKIMIDWSSKIMTISTAGKDMFSFENPVFGYNRPYDGRIR